METLDRLIGQLSEEIDVRPARVVDEAFGARCKLEPVKADLLTRGERRKRSKREREQSAGAKWFDLPSKELDMEEKLTIDALRLRETLDPSRFYKRKATEEVAKQFQIGTVVEHPIDFYSSRATRRERKQTIVDELIADAEFKRKVKQRYSRLRASNAIRLKERALAERRKLLQERSRLKRREFELGKNEA